MKVEVEYIGQVINKFSREDGHFSYSPVYQKHNPYLKSKVETEN